MQDRATLDVLDDSRAIHRLMDSYCWYADTFQFDRWGACFTEDAVFEHATLGATFRGRDGIREAFVEMVSGKIARTHHIITNCWFDFTGGHAATGRGSLLLVVRPDEADIDRHVQSGGIYHWEFEKSDQWRIARSRLETLWQSSSVARAA